MQSKVARKTVDLSVYTDLVVVYLGMRVNALHGLKRLLGLGPQISSTACFLRIARRCVQGSPKSGVTWLVSCRTYGFRPPMLNLKLAIGMCATWTFQLLTAVRHLRISMVFSEAGLSHIES